MFSLPAELKLSIFSLLNHKDLINVMTTCKEYKNFGADSSLWKQLVTRDFYCAVPDNIEPIAFYKTLAIERKNIINLMLKFELLILNAPEVHPVLLLLEFVGVSFDISAGDEQTTKLKEMNSKLINYSLSPNNIELTNQTCLTEIEFFKDPDLLNVLLLAGLINTRSNNLLELILIKRPDLAKYEDECGFSALQQAIEALNLKAVEILLKHGAAYVVRVEDVSISLSAISRTSMAIDKFFHLEKNDPKLLTFKEIFKLLLQYKSNNSVLFEYLITEENYKKKLGEKYETSIQKEIIDLIKNWKPNVRKQPENLEMNDEHSDSPIPKRRRV